MYGSTRETLHCKPNIGRKVTTTTILVAGNNVAAAHVAVMAAVAEDTTNSINSATLNFKNINLSRKSRFSQPKNSLKRRRPNWLKSPKV